MFINYGVDYPHLKRKKLIEFSHLKSVNEFTEFAEFLFDTDGVIATCGQGFIAICGNLLFLVPHCSHLWLEPHM